MPRPKLFLELNLARHALMSRMDAELAERLDVSVTQLVALFALRREDGLTMSELADRTYVDAAAVTRVVAHLTRKALAERRRDPDDGRVRRLFLTDAGRAIATEGLGLVDQVNAELHDPFTPDELELVARYLRHVRSWARQESP
jgi:DNA-binding MarR family transcriptional regulator